MTEQCYLGVDLGAESGRVVAGLFDGEKVRLDVVHRFSNNAVHIAGTQRWDVLRLWSDIQEGLQHAGTRFSGSVRSVGIDTWGVDYVLLSESGEILTQPYQYRDARTQGRLEELLQEVPRSEVFSATGVQFMPINTLVQLYAMQQTDGDLLSMADQLLLMPDFFHWCLSGSKAVEFTNATTTQCFDPTERNWAFGLLRKLELPLHIFPEVVMPGTNLGRLRPEVASHTGLGDIPVIAPATHDTGAAVAAIPTESTGKPNWAYISSGTWSLMGVEVNDAILTERALSLNVTNEGGVDGTFRLLKNIMGLWLVQQCRKSFERAGKSLDYTQLMIAAAEAPPFSQLLDPDDPSFLNPDDMPTAIREFCRKHGQPEPQSEGEFVRSALEGLALKYRMVLDWLEQLTGTRVEVIHIVGGGSQNELLNQFTADACGRPVVAGPVEATALGNVLVQARAAGELSSLEEIREVSRRSGELRRYEPNYAAEWTIAYGKFLELVSRAEQNGG